MNAVSKNTTGDGGPIRLTIEIPNVIMHANIRAGTAF